MRPDRSWMLRRIDPTGYVSEEFKDGVDDFIKVAKGDPTVADALSRIPCPCARCKNHVRMESFWVEAHLYKYGFIEGYVNWTIHGENRWGDSGSTSIVHDNEVETRYPYVDMVMDATGDKLNPKAQDLEKDLNPSASKFNDLVRDTDEPLWDGCHKHTKLSAITQLLNLKSEFNMSESCYDQMIVVIKSMLPESNRLPENFYKSKQMVSELGLGYEKKDACPNHCMLYYKENSDKRSYSICSVCGHPRLKAKAACSTNQKDVNFIDYSYDIAMSEKYGEDSSSYPMVDPEVWLDGIGSNKKGRVDGMGNNLDIGIHDSKHASSSRAPGPPCTTPLTQVNITEVVNEAIASFVKTQLKPMLVSNLSRILQTGNIASQAPPQGKVVGKGLEDDDDDGAK